MSSPRTTTTATPTEKKPSASPASPAPSASPVPTTSSVPTASLDPSASSTSSTPSASPTPSAPKAELFKVFVGNLSFSTTTQSLAEFFSQEGKVLETIISKQGRRPRGYGFVAYGSDAEAEKAVANLDKKELDGREIIVEKAKPREPKPDGEKKKKKSSKKSRKTADEGTPSEGSVDPISSVETSQDKPTEPKAKTTIFVANLPLSFKVDDLSQLFSAYQVESTFVAIKKNGGSKGYGFVELKTINEMNNVLKLFGEVEIDGRALHISAATSEKNTERKPKSKTSTAPPAAEEQQEQQKTKKTKRNRKASNKKKAAAKKNEGVEAVKEAQEADVQLKGSDGVEAADQVKEAVLELKKEDGGADSKKMDAAKATDAVKK